MWAVHSSIRKIFLQKLSKNCEFARMGAKKSLTTYLAARLERLSG
jgi:hypothetical protein